MNVQSGCSGKRRRSLSPNAKDDVAVASAALGVMAGERAVGE